MSRLLNLGCGSCFHSAFTNVDFTARGPGVIAWDLRAGLPFPEASFDVVYHAHVLEHFEREAARRLLRECHRVLVPGGLIRVCVPDLAQWARAYLQNLTLAERGDRDAAERHEWLLVELLDQMVRTRSGGAFLDALRDASPALRTFIESRIGPFSEFLPPDHPAAVRPAGNWKDFFRPLVRWVKSADTRRDRRIRRALGPDYAGYERARFAERGENHRWMYDALSLRRELTSAGFREIAHHEATTSGHPAWPSYQLDTFPDGASRRPNSLYLEARKPAPA